jgi:hypothetical protein
MIENLFNYIIDSSGVIQNKTTGKILKAHLLKGYPTISLRDQEGKKKNYLVHRLVAMTYIPNPDNKPFVNHLDGDTTNFKVDNLEWCTQKENIYHSRNLTGNGSVISKKKLLELYSENPELTLEAFIKVVTENCN